MADVTGALHHEFGGRTYCLRLTMAGLGRVQDRHGNDLGGLLSDDASAVPPFSVLVLLVAVALEKGERIGADDAADLADEMMTADPGLSGRLLHAAFPGMFKGGPGNAKAPARKRRRG